MLVIPSAARNRSVACIREEEIFLVAALLAMTTNDQRCFLSASSSTVPEFSPAFNFLIIIR
jgi:hypothetical protein